MIHLRPSIALLALAALSACSSSDRGGNGAPDPTGSRPPPDAGPQTDANPDDDVDADTGNERPDGGPDAGAECTSEEKRCEGRVPVHCASDGTWQSGAACEFVCDEGECTGECTPDEKRCDGLVPKTCSEGGTWQSGAACEFVCDEGECAGECTPDEKRCDGLVPQTCSGDGAWSNGAPCAYVCEAGACTGECVPGTQECAGLVPRTCDATGTWQAHDACEFVCDSGECTGSCVPGSKQCDNLEAQTCDATGAWQATDTCDFVCAAGECTGVCVPGSQDCAGLVPRTCDATGTWQTGDSCSYVCASGACTGVCSPGETRCADADTVEVCSALGQWEASDCLQVCSSKTDRCECGPGYVGDGDTCTAIDFCDPENGGCSPDAACAQTGAAPSCTCDSGFLGDGLSCSPAPVRRVDEQFDDITTLDGKGWTMANLSQPLGTTSWFQGNTTVFSAFEGAAHAYIGANYNNVGSANTISNWLISPALPFGARAALSFYTRKVAGVDYPDRIEVRLCPAEPCALPANNADVGGYTVLLGAVNPTLTTGVYPTTWTRFSYDNASGLPYAGQGRIAIRYWVTNGGPAAANSDYIGIDAFVAETGTPAYTVGGTVSGLTEGGLVLWLNGQRQLPVSANGAFAFDGAYLDTGTPYSVRVHTQPESQTCTVSQGAGSIGSADVTNVAVTCVPDL